MTTLPHPAMPTHHTLRTTGLLVASAWTLVGCSSMSGLGGETRYACKAPTGVVCDSVSGNYANTLHGAATAATGQPAMPSRTAPPVRREPPPAIVDLATTPGASPAPASPALRSLPRILRLWTKPWTDADGDLYDQAYVYVQVDNGQWQIEHVQRRIRDAHAPLRPPATPPAPAGPVEGSTDQVRPGEPAPSARTTPLDSRRTPVPSPPGSTPWTSPLPPTPRGRP